MTDILYIHGMGGGESSRIPSFLVSEGLDVVVRTYDFDPRVASGQIASWIRELQPRMLVGESLGSIHTLAARASLSPELPVVLVSPSLNAPLYFHYTAFFTFIPGMTALFDRIYRPKREGRQTLHFVWKPLRSWLPLRRIGLEPVKGSTFAFFGTHDHYRRSGIVRIGTYRRYFGDSYAVYDGTHFMEEEYLKSMLIPRIREVLASAV